MQNIRCHHIKFTHPGETAPKICVPLHYHSISQNLLHH
jgi:hypothetical protein